MPSFISKHELFAALACGGPMPALDMTVVNAIEREDGSNHNYNVTGYLDDGREVTVFVRVDSPYRMPRDYCADDARERELWDSADEEEWQQHCDDEAVAWQGTFDEHIQRWKCYLRCTFDVAPRHYDPAYQGDFNAHVEQWNHWCDSWLADVNEMDDESALRF
jgi:hypothetical protein